MSGRNQHVVPDPQGGWDIKGEHAQRATKHFDTKQDAINHARNISINQSSELFIHNRDGKISGRDSHGHDPRSSKG